MALHNQLGALGEQKAIEYLLENNYSILEKNWRFKRAEIDVIAKKNDKLYCIEVKTRSNTSYGNPEIFVNKKKINMLLLAINKYVEQYDINLEIQFDIIAIVFKNETFKLEHIENAYYYF